jgi:very-short-patch-repair endonuclease
MPRDKSRIPEARANRRQPSPAEAAFWLWTRDRRRVFKWRRQHPVAGRVVDFYSAEARLVVELLAEGEEESDELFQRMEQLGLMVVSIPEADLMDDNKVKSAEWLTLLEGLCRSRQEPPS